MKFRKYLLLFFITPILLGSCTDTENSNYLCADGSSKATVWNDLNADGIKTDNEPPISDVCVYARYTNNSDKNDEWYIANCKDHKSTSNSGFTSEYGFWMSMFMVGDCGDPEEVGKSLQDQCKGIAISVVVPSGYKATTPTTAIGCEAFFGLEEIPE